MGEYRQKTIKDIVKNYINENTFLPAIQRGYVWDKNAIEKLFDSIMCDYPISAFMFWKVRGKIKREWLSFEFIRDFDADMTDNQEARLDGDSDVNFVLDGQQRMTSLYIGLKGSYKKGKKKEYLYLNLLKPVTDDVDTDELTYEFSFRKDNTPDKNLENEQYWYKVGEILNYEDAEDAKENLTNSLQQYSEEQKTNALKIIGKLYGRICSKDCISFYQLAMDDEDKDRIYNKVVEIFVRTNTGGTKLEYSDILLSKATATWSNSSARTEINSFTEELSEIGAGYNIGKDFVMKGAMYLTDGLPIQYKVSSFTTENLKKIESNWEVIKKSLKSTIQLMANFGFVEKNITSKNSLLPIAQYLKISGIKIDSSESYIVSNLRKINKWLISALLQNIFSGSSDSILKSTQVVFTENSNKKDFPISELGKKIGIRPFSKDDIDDLLVTKYGKYSFLVLSLLYPDRNLYTRYNEDHIFPKVEFTEAKLKKRGYTEDQIKKYREYYNTVLNLELLSESENKSKNDTDFQEFLVKQDEGFKKEHFIPPLDNELTSYDFDHFLEFIEKRKELLIAKLTKALN